MPKFSIQLRQDLRATDPDYPRKFHQSLVNHLQNARLFSPVLAELFFRLEGEEIRISKAARPLPRDKSLRTAEPYKKHETEENLPVYLKEELDKAIREGISLVLKGF